MSTASAPTHQWYYFSDDFLGNSKMIGPVAEPEFVSLVKRGELGLGTQVNSPSRTQGNWLELRQVTVLVKLMQDGENERKEAKARVAAERERQRKDAVSARQAVANQEQARVAQFSDCQDLGMVATIEERVRAILTSNESLQYIAVQEKPLVNIKPDAIVVTDRRLIFYRPKLLGRFDFQDFLWFDLFNVHFQQNLLGATFWAQHVSGQVVSMDYLPSQAAQKLYRIAQEREEQSRLRRHNLQLETMRAGAAQVNVQTNVPSPAAGSVNSTIGAASSSSHDELLKRLETLKTMHDRGLITADDFNRRKQEILAQI